ncbi:hypothetical protein EG329_000978 [Mollisiaceae sp. DMI_Dod_QoI]|nr:hypothetical protein EG329_000978 [Helotiales sp. DMI_Dod_QoI]
MPPWSLIDKAISAVNSGSLAPLTNGLAAFQANVEPVSQGWQIVESASSKSRKKSTEAHGKDDTNVDSPTRGFKYITISLQNLSDEFEQVKFEQFSLGQPATRWCRTMLLGQPVSTMDARIAESMTEVFKENGVEGVLEAILWATTYKFQSGETSFWRKVENAANVFLMVSITSS